MGRGRGEERWESWERGDRLRRKGDSVQTATVDQSDSSRLWPVAVWASVSARAGGNEPRWMRSQTWGLSAAAPRRGVARANTHAPLPADDPPPPRSIPPAGAHDPVSVIRPITTLLPLGPAARSSTLAFSPLQLPGHAFSTIHPLHRPRPSLRCPTIQRSKYIPLPLQLTALPRSPPATSTSEYPARPGHALFRTGSRIQTRNASASVPVWDTPLEYHRATTTAFCSETPSGTQLRPIPSFAPPAFTPSPPSHLPLSSLAKPRSQPFDLPHPLILFEFLLISLFRLLSPFIPFALLTHRNLHPVFTSQPPIL